MKNWPFLGSFQSAENKSSKLNDLTVAEIESSENEGRKSTTNFENTINSGENRVLAPNILRGG